MKHVQDIDNKNNLRIEVINDLKDLGVKVPAKLKRLKYLREDSNVVSFIIIHTAKLLFFYLYFLQYI